MSIKVDGDDGIKMDGNDNSWEVPPVKTLLRKRLALCHSGWVISRSTREWCGAHDSAIGTLARNCEWRKENPIRPEDLITARLLGIELL